MRYSSAFLKQTTIGNEFYTSKNRRQMHILSYFCFSDKAISCEEYTPNISLSLPCSISFLIKIKALFIQKSNAQFSSFYY